MRSGPIPVAPDEALRLERLAILEIMDTPAEQDFDAVVELARRLLACPMALVSLVDDHRQWFKARSGVDVAETPRDQAFCAHAIGCDEIMVVEDAGRDARFADNPLVTGAPHIRFYAGAPLRSAALVASESVGAIGTLCVLDTEPRGFSDDDRKVLRMLAGLVESLIQARFSAARALRASEQVRHNAALVDRKNRQLRQAERMAAIGSWRFDLATGRVEWSDEVFAIHDLPVGEEPPLGDALRFYPEDQRGYIGNLLERAASHGEGYDFESDLITATGAVRRVRAIAEAETVDDQRTAVIGVFQDVTERYRHEINLRQTANTDSLTGLPNRRMFEERLEELKHRSARTAEPFAVVIIDLDGFKPVNDTFGHEAGDAVLREMAERLRGQVFSHAFSARLGGDEFVMLVTRPRDCADLAPFVQSVLRDLRHLVERDGIRLAVTATVGAALFADSAAPDADVLHQADLALYAAKRAQRGTGRIFGDSDLLTPWGVRKVTPVKAVR